MDRIDGRPVYSATDLAAYLACDHLVQLERAAIAGLVDRPIRDDPELDVIRRRGFEHEHRFLDDCAAAERTVVTIEIDGSATDRGVELRAAAQRTIEAMEAGADVVYQATFFDGSFRGHADFLLRVDDPDRPSRFGPWHYEVADTKLARHVKASAVLQVCSYVDQLERIQGVRPTSMHIALGGSSRTTEHLAVDDFMAYYRTVRDRFLAALTADEPPVYPPASTYPEPVEHCDVCRWAAQCAAQRRRDDHLSLVAGISARQRRALEPRGVTTLETLGRLELPMIPRLEGTSATALARVRDQARIQLEGRLTGSPRYELFVPEAGQPIDTERGLASLPTPSMGDLFFDIEGDPYAFDDGLDYLFGVLDGDGTYTAIWSRDDRGEFSLDGERAAFEQLMDLFAERLAADPGLHIYHYAAYEPTALKRLMGRHGTREDEVDRLLRGGVLVDLLRAVRQGLRASVESYSIKKMEAFYGFTRDVDLRDAGSSIVAFETWLQLGEGERPAATELDRIERYNLDDVRSNQELRDWLEGRREESARLAGRPVPRPVPREATLPEDASERAAEVQALVDRLTDGVPSDPAERTDDEAARWLLAQLLGWHRREDKAMWWEFHRLMDLTPDELVDDDGAVGHVEFVERVDDRYEGKPAWRFTYPDQEVDAGRIGGELHDPARKAADPDGNPFEWKVATLLGLDLAARTIDLRLDKDRAIPAALVPLPFVRTTDLQESLKELARSVADQGMVGAGPDRAVRDLLLRRPPRVGQPDGADVPMPDRDDLSAVTGFAHDLDATVLPVQGPPGSGKTWTGARLILGLLAAGKRVGITATSHKVIGNLLRAVLDDADGARITAIQRADRDVAVDDDRVLVTPSPKKTRERLDDGDASLVAGTPWLWASGSMRGSVDVLVVDEAGQISLANVVAIGRATESLILLGDPQQLDQPRRGVHPPGADRSALAHALGEHATIPPDRGWFLEQTWRLHPAICDFTSEVFYEGRLAPIDGLERQRVRDSGADLVGLRLLGDRTEGADNESPLEAAAVATLVRDLIDGGATWTDRHGLDHPLGWEDILIVAPYNAQVAAIARLLPHAARVGTVDKFQGQEAAISIYSMTTSSPELAPRGMDFLYSGHRLDVATSRARCLGLVVASPDLLRVRARTPAQMRLANAFCRFAELAARPADDQAGRGPTMVVRAGD